MGAFDKELHGLIYDIGGDWRNVKHRDYGAVGDGSTDDRAAFAAVDATGAYVVVPKATGGSYSIQSDLTLGGNYYFLSGAQIAPNATSTVTFNGEVHAGRYQIFASATSAVVLTQPERQAEWWGATGPLRTLPQSDTKPNVGRGQFWETANATAITLTAFQDTAGGTMPAGSRLTLVAGDNNTTIQFQSAGFVRGNGGQSWTMTSGDHMVCVLGASGVWYCDVSDNTT